MLSLSIGVLLSASFLWLVGLGASAPMPEFLTGYKLFAINYYSGIITALSSLAMSGLVLSLSRRYLSTPRGQQGLVICLPIAGFLIYWGIATPSVLTSVLYAAIPMLLGIAVFMVVRSKAEQ